jgi:hypothetical protein
VCQGVGYFRSMFLVRRPAGQYSHTNKQHRHLSHHEENGIGHAPRRVCHHSNPVRYHDYFAPTARGLKVFTHSTLPR